VIVLDYQHPFAACRDQKDELADAAIDKVLPKLFIAVIITSIFLSFSDGRLPGLQFI